MQSQVPAPSETEYLKSQLKGCSAQLEAIKQMCNEYIQSSIQLRSNLILLQQENQELRQQVDTHRGQVSTLSAKVLELQPPVANEELTPVTPVQ